MSTDLPKTKLRFSDYRLFPDDGKIHELIDGMHYMTPAPTPDHQTVSKRIQHFLYTEIELTGLGLVFNAPIDVQFGEYNGVQPDLIVLLKKNKTASITPTHVKGAPDLVIEILSPSTRKKDLKLKRNLYEQFGVREYWIVDPKQKSVTQLVLVDREYQPVASPRKCITLKILPKISISLEKIWI